MSKVESFTQADESEYPSWWIMKVKDEEIPFLVSNNWVALFGELHPGDEVEYEISNSPIYAHEKSYKFTQWMKIVKRVKA